MTGILRHVFDECSPNTHRTLIEASTHVRGCVAVCSHIDRRPVTDRGEN